MDDKVKDLLEYIRGTAQEAADAAVGTARVAGRKAGQMMDAAKLNMQLFDLNSDFNDVLRQLGQVMYNTHLGQIADGDPVNDLLKQADSLSEKITAAKDRMDELRRVHTCPSCGTACGKNDKFCRHCGKDL